MDAKQQINLLEQMVNYVENGGKRPWVRSLDYQITSWAAANLYRKYGPAAGEATPRHRRYNTLREELSKHLQIVAQKSRDGLYKYRRSAWKSPENE